MRLSYKQKAGLGRLVLGFRACSGYLVSGPKTLKAVSADHKTQRRRTVGTLAFKQPHFSALTCGLHGFGRLGSGVYAVRAAQVRVERNRGATVAVARARVCVCVSFSKTAT